MSKIDNILIVVQARMGSTRLQGKTMLPILGKTLLCRMVERLQQIRNKVQIVIATSQEKVDDKIAEEAAVIGVSCYRGSLTNLLDRHYRAGEKFSADVVIKIPSDCPLIDPEIIDNVIDFYYDTKGWYDFISNLHPASWPDGNDVELMTMTCLERVWKEAKRQLELEHTTPYIWENPDLFKMGNVKMEGGKDLSKSHRFTIDYWEDYLFIKEVFEQLYPIDTSFSCNDILALLNERKDIYDLNAKYAGEYWYRNHAGELKTV